MCIMSRAIASARQRRAGLTQPEPIPVPPKLNSAGDQPAGGLTLPQVIALVDTRLTKLEKFMKESQEVDAKPVKIVSQVEISGNQDKSESKTDGEPLTDLNEILDDFNNRFVLLAEEIAQLKDTIMKLQSYTMDVNKMLLEERVNVLSDIGENNTMFIMNNTTLSEGEIDKIVEFQEPPLKEE